ncbi:MAG: Na(+)-translocating NADH-quinone reductase subunit C [Kangiellaceae bacterium]|jgi:Na+-transporting NADH:ubiquinone oxidoreductase subunit C|nr:Na(+)-translocating NADH-quinone reductase subunit C [Kangiellaceae bacterium]
MSANDSAKNNDSFFNTIIVATVLCLVCSLMVAGSAISLKSDQQRNKAADVQKSILLASGLVKAGEQADFDQLFADNIETKIIDIASGEFVEGIDLAKFDQRKAANNPATNKELSQQEDIASIKRRAKQAKVYLVKDGDNLKSVILPIKGYGLYSMLYGFIALEADTKTVSGLKFYEHGETPGLGAEIENPKWIATWIGKEVYDNNYSPAIKLVKTGANTKSEVDALSGASMTSRGVENLLTYWLGNDGFGPFLAKVRGGNHGV